MKQKIYTFAVIDAIIIMTGAIFKVQHFPGAGYLLILGLGGLVFFILPAGLISNYKNSTHASGPLLHIITWITCFVIFTAMIFKIQHWPGAGIALLIALPFPYLIFLPVYILVTSKDPGHNVYNTVLVLLLLAVNSVFSALLALNVTYRKIAESYVFAGNYNRIETVLTKMPENQSAISMKIDDVLKSIDKYQEVILKYDGRSEKEWSSEPVLLRPDSQQDAYIALDNEGLLKPGNELETRLRILLEAFKSDPHFKDLDAAVLSIFGLEPADNNYFYPVAGVTFNNPLTWTLIWFDSLETNLRLIKASL